MCIHYYHRCRYCGHSKRGTDVASRIHCGQYWLARLANPGLKDCPVGEDEVVATKGRGETRCDQCRVHKDRPEKRIRKQCKSREVKRNGKAGLQHRGAGVKLGHGLRPSSAETDMETNGISNHHQDKTGTKLQHDVNRPGGSHQYILPKQTENDSNRLAHGRVVGTRGYRLSAIQYFQGGIDGKRKVEDNSKWLDAQRHPSSFQNPLNPSLLMEGNLLCQDSESIAKIVYKLPAQGEESR
ncbi:hypothetical protein MMC28_004598 [Mycoblastus sanguinarius]|nr:hypothetical protein [Mycoblastus sanguinarius]